MGDLNQVTNNENIRKEIAHLISDTILRESLVNDEDP